MRKQSFVKSFLALFLVVAVGLFSNAAFAQDDDDFGGDDDELGDSIGGDDGGAGEEPPEPEAPKSRTEKEWLDFILSKIKDDYKKKNISFDLNKPNPFLPSVADKDPFKPLVEKKVIAPPARPKPVATSASRNAPPPKPQIKPIQIKVQGIVGNDGQRLAIINFENQELIVSKDQNVEGKFKVVDIQADRITVYSNKEQRRHSFKVGGDDGGKRDS